MNSAALEPRFLQLPNHRQNKVFLRKGNWTTGIFLPSEDEMDPQSAPLIRLSASPHTTLALC